jgi:hypothetical protein
MLLTYGVALQLVNYSLIIKLPLYTLISVIIYFSCPQMFPPLKG